MYLGNDLSQNSKYHSAFETLKNNLRSEGYTLITASSMKNQFFRLFHMIFVILTKGRKTDFILIDTFSTNAFYFAFVCSQLASLLQKKYIPILHGGDLPKRLKKSPKLSSLLFKNSYINVSPSNFLKHEFSKYDFKVKLIPNSIILENYKFKERSSIQPKLLYVRAFASIYNPLLAIEVLEIVLQKYSKAELCMVGPDRDGTLALVQQEIKKRGLEKKVTITGVLPKEKWHELSKNYDVFINTTNIDNTPVSLIETMALGLPIVTTNVGGIPYLVEDEIDSLLVTPNNAVQMSDAIFKLLESDVLVQNLSRNGREKAEAMDWNAVKELWNEILVG